MATQQAQKNKTAIVTGASGNLGHAVVQKFLDAGYNVVGTVIPNDPAPLNIDNPRFEKVAADLGNEMDSQKLVDAVVAKYGQVHVAVLTVGGFAMGKIAETKTSDIMKQYRLNFETAYNVAQPLFVKMMEGGYGRIFIIGSKAGLDARNNKGVVAYGMAKSLLFRLAELMNDEAKGHDVVSTVIVPSTIDTPQNRKAMPEADPNKWVKAEEIANIIYWHSTDESRIIRETVIKAYNNA